ncbi:MAG: hypothetical protein M3R38_19515, partial [Actinomycetota bacterium]|nr:hypothetical protein [Actinomycetota bacterium]
MGPVVRGDGFLTGRRIGSFPGGIAPTPRCAGVVLPLATVVVAAVATSVGGLLAASEVVRSVPGGVGRGVLVLGCRPSGSRGRVGIVRLRLLAGLLAGRGTGGSGGVSVLALGGRLLLRLARLLGGRGARLLWRRGGRLRRLAGLLS